VTAPRRCGGDRPGARGAHLPGPTRSIRVELIPKVRITGYNVGLTRPTTPPCKTGLGSASHVLAEQAVTNTALARRMVTRGVGPLSGHWPRLGDHQPGCDHDLRRLRSASCLPRAGDSRHAVRSLRARVDDQHLEPLVRTAIDLTIDGMLDPRGALHLIANNFNAAGWFWGAGFTTEDAQHFEAGSALVQTW
jgi:hypothetical protein